MSASTRLRRAVWPIMLLTLASTVGAWHPVWDGVPDLFTPVVTDDTAAWEVRSVPAPDNGVTADPGTSHVARTPAQERLTDDSADKGLAGPAPGAIPADRSLRPYPSRASPV